jgi:WD40 repeat protein/serine/threonine protein kinase
MIDNPRVRDILDRAADLPKEQRPAFLDTACGSDTALRAEVESLLRSLDTAGEFLLSPTITAVGANAGTAPTTAANDLGSTIGPYRLISVIGEGGMGVVYLAEQDQPVRRRVALKVIKPGMDTAAVIARFEAERQALALMDHSNIARVYDVGSTAAGRPYFVMELVEGVSITRYCDQQRLTPEQRLELFVPVCAAIQHAHQKGIIHRDLKPGNILVTVEDGRPMVKVIDFGIARAIDQPLRENAAFTQLGALVGTPEYMSPEQAAGDSALTDTRSDIYALGVILYELLTGSTPLDRKQLLQAGYEQMMRTIRESEPPRPSTRLSGLGDGIASASALRQMEPRRLAKMLVGDLDVIVMKCLEKDRTRRYETASGLGQDLRRFLSNDPVEARPPSSIYLFGKFARKHRKGLSIAAAFVVVVVAALLTTSIVFWILKTEANGKRDDAVKARIEADAARANADAQRASAVAANAQVVLLKNRAETQAYQSSIFAAGAAVNMNNFGEASAFLDKSPPKLRNWEWNYLHATANPQVMTFNISGFDGLKFLSDGSLFATWGKEIHFYDPSTGREVRTLTALRDKNLRPFAMSPDGKRYIAERHGEWTLVVLDENGQELASIPKSKQSLTYVYTTLFTRDHTKFITEARDDPGIVPPQVGHEVRIWDTATATELFHLPPEAGYVVSTRLSPDESKLLTGSTDGVVKVWDFKTGQCLSTYRDPNGGWIGGVFSADGKRVVSVANGFARQAVIWDATSPDGKVIRALTDGMHMNLNMSADFSPDGKLVAVSGGKFATVFDADTGAVVAVLRGHVGRVPGVQFIGDGSRLLTGSNDGTVRIWDLGICSRPPVYGDKTHPVVDAKLSADGKLLTTWSADSVVRVYDTFTRQLKFTLDPNAPPVAATTRPVKPFDPTTPRVAVPRGDGTVTIFDATTGQPACTIGDPFPMSTPVVTAFTADGTRAITGTAWGTLRVWDLVTGRPVATLSVHGPPVDRILIDPQDHRIITTTRTGAGQLWDLSTNQFIGSINGRDFAFSHDGKSVVTPGDLEGVIYDCSTARKLGTTGFSHWSAVLTASFSRDDSKVVITYQDDIAEVWDIATKSRQFTLYGHQGYLMGGVYNPDGSRILTWSRDNTARIWDATTGAELLPLQGHTGVIRHAEFSADGTKILTVSEDGTARVWDSIPNEQRTRPTSPIACIWIVPGGPACGPDG